MVTRVIGADDDDVALAAAELLELGRTIGVVQGLLDELLLARLGLELVLMAFHQAGEVLVFQLEMHGLVVKRQVCLKHLPSHFRS